MAASDHIGVRVRRFVHLVVVLVSAAFVAAPLLLGPATSTLMRALGGADEHHCACGMKAGECGCPTCERLEAERLAEREAPQPFIHSSSCDDGGRVPLSSALPAAVPPACTIVPPAAAERVTSTFVAIVDSSRGRAPPDTPPPRRGA